MKTEKVRVLPALLVALLFVGIVVVVLDTPLGTGTGVEATTYAVGETIFDDFLASFELVAVLLVASLLAGVYLAKPDESRGEAVREAVSAKPRVEAEGAQEVEDATE